MTDPPHILIVDDEPRIRNMLRRYLVEEGFKVSDAGDGAGVRAVLAREVIHLVLLDLMMPGEDGLSLARYIRQHSEIPIIMLTGKGDLIDRVVGLESRGGRLHPQAVRAARGPCAHPDCHAQGRSARCTCCACARRRNTSEVLVFEGWRLDVLRRELRRQTGDLVALTAGEFELLCAFARHPNRVLNRDQLIDLVKGREWAAYDRGVDTQVMRLRKKIEADPSNPSVIKTVRGSGYVFAAAVTVD